MPFLNPIRAFNQLRQAIQGEPSPKQQRTQTPQRTPRKAQPTLAPRDRNQTGSLAQGKAEQCRIYQPEETHVHQYSNDSELKALPDSAKQREAQANCGPSSAAIVLGKMGIEAPSLHELRSSVGAPLGTQSHSAYAIDCNQLIQMVKETAAEHGHQVYGAVHDLPRTAEAAWEHLQSRMYLGMPTVLLTGNMSSSGPGHYVVVEGARNGKLQINDPQFEDGARKEHSFEEFKAAFERRQRAGRYNLLVSFMPDYRKV